MKSSYLTTFFILFSLLFFSCDHRSDDYSVINTSSTLDYYAIEVFNDKIYAAGGEVWKQCDLSISSDGIEWTSDYFTNRAIFDLHATDSDLYAVGASGYFFHGSPDLNKIDLTTYRLFKGLTKVDGGFVAVAGKDFNKGWLYPMDNDYKVLNEYTYDHELTDVKCDQNGHCIATGYGIILYSLDYGINWNRSSQDGDFYSAVSYNSNETPFIVGYNGSILYSDDHGITWEAIKNAHSPLNNNKPFRKIKFFNDVGYIVGDNGTIWKSVDDGENWSDISIKTELDLIDYTIFHNNIFIASEGGKIIKVDL